MASQIGKELAEKAAKEAAEKAAKELAEKIAKEAAEKAAKEAAEKASKEVAEKAAKEIAEKAAKEAAEKAAKEAAEAAGKEAAEKAAKKALTETGSTAAKKTALEMAGESAKAAGKKAAAFASKHPKAFLALGGAAAVSAAALAKFENENNAKFVIVKSENIEGKLWIEYTKIGNDGKEPFKFNTASKILFMDEGFEPSLKDKKLEIIDVQGKTKFAVLPEEMPTVFATSGTIQYKTSFDAAVGETVKDFAEEAVEISGDVVKGTFESVLSPVAEGVMGGVADALGIDYEQIKMIAMGIGAIICCIILVGFLYKLKNLASTFSD